VPKTQTCKVQTADELDSEIQNILTLELLGLKGKIPEVLHVEYADESVKSANLVARLEARGIAIVWHKTS
jgi:hypothetical protein